MIIPLHAGNPGAMTGSGNWTYLLCGKVPLLIDAGVGTAEHLDAIAAHAADGPSQVIVTHAHDDHASGAMAIRRRWPRTRFMKMPWPDRDWHYAVEWNALHDGDVLHWDDELLHVVHTPGHAPDHICLWHPSTRSLFCGDLVVLGSTVVIPGSHGGSLTAYLDSLKRVSALQPARLLPAHGSVIEDPQTVIHDYLAHRASREQQVLSAIAAGIDDIDTITDRIYAELAPALRPMARESVLAHLLKLNGEGRVDRVGERWQLSRSDRSNRPG